MDERTGILGGHNSPKRRAREKTLHLMRMIEDRRRRSGPDIEDTDEHLLTYAELAALRDGWPKGRRRADQYEGPLKIKATR